MYMMQDYSGAKARFIRYLLNIIQTRDESTP